MGYLAYYLAIFACSYATSYPYAAALVIVVYLLRGYLPDPVIWLRTASKMRALATQIHVNPANITARRDLARLYLRRRRPKAALKLLDEARARDPEDAELLYLTALARHRSGDSEGAIEPIVAAVAISPVLLYGEPYLLASDVLMKLSRFEEAEDALERYMGSNSSSVQGWLKLALVRNQRRNNDGAKRALREAFTTWSQLPRYKRRQEFGWWLQAVVTRILI
ncbi:tetratricopeptide repeat protein [Pendulispora albinea]|uniref:Tetratricopeptide repeat protein n=1 Tax=Pendulispora albinea TaxID=2741071 RepID=A0ABZ2LWL8_9BACT